MENKRNRFNLIGRMQDFMDSVTGKTLLNYLYSWGASIVILGALFKLTHIPGANLMLFLGMGTEVIVFFFFAFDRSSINQSYDKESAEEKQQTSPAYLQEGEESNSQEKGYSQAAYSGNPIVTGGGGNAGTPIIIGGGNNANGPIVIGGGASGGGNTSGPIMIGGGSPIAIEGNGESPANGVETPVYINGGFAGNGGEASNLSSVPEIEEVTQSYIDRIKELTEALKHVTDQSSALERNMEEMELLGRNLTGINTIYEMQLRSVSAQVGNIDQVNEQTRKMALQIEELNKVYARMLEAMTVNMRNNPNCNL